jgi:hypothetical protein
MTNPLAEHLVPGICDFAQAHEMRIVRQSEAESFGNGLLVLEGDSLQLRIVRDRGQISFDVGNLHETDWHSLEHILAFVGANPTDTPLASLANQFEAIVSVMNTDAKRAEYMIFEKQQNTAFLQKLLSGPNH